MTAGQFLLGALQRRLIRIGGGCHGVDELQKAGHLGSHIRTDAGHLSCRLVCRQKFRIETLRIQGRDLPLVGDDIGKRFVKLGILTGANSIEEFISMRCRRRPVSRDIVERTFCQIKRSFVLGTFVHPEIPLKNWVPL